MQATARAVGGALRRHRAERPALGDRVPHLDRRRDRLERRQRAVGVAHGDHGAVHHPPGEDDLARRGRDDPGPDADREVDPAVAPGPGERGRVEQPGHLPGARGQHEGRRCRRGGGRREEERRPDERGDGSAEAGHGAHPAGAAGRPGGGPDRPGDRGPSPWPVRIRPVRTRPGRRVRFSVHPVRRVTSRALLPYPAPAGRGRGARQRSVLPPRGRRRRAPRAPGGVGRPAGS